MAIAFARKYILAAISVAALITGWLLWRGTTPLPPPVAARAAAPTLEPKLLVDSFRYRKTSEYDPGTIRLYVRNGTAQPAAFKQVLLDGLPIKVWGVDWDVENKNEPAPAASPSANEKTESAQAFVQAAKFVAEKRAVWARIEPSPLPAGAIAELSVKLAAPMSRPMKIELLPTGGESLKAIVRPNLSKAISFSSITFDPQFNKLYCYLQATTDAELNLETLSVDGTPVDAQSWFSSRQFANNSRHVAIVTLAAPLKQGQFVTLKASCQGGIETEERVRVFSGFPINVENGNPPPGFGLDPESYTTQAMSYIDSAPADISPSHFKGRIHIFDCAMHTYAADKSRSALEILRRRNQRLVSDPLSPSMVHLCRIRPEDGFALFAETSDILEMNPDVTTGFSNHLKKDPPEIMAARLAHFAYLASTPHPFHALVDPTKFGAPKESADAEEFRRRTYAVLGEGSRALIYRHGGWNDPASPVNPEIRRINAEIASVRDFLAISAPVDWVSPDPSSACSAYALLAGNEKVVLIVVKSAAAPANPVHVKLQAPNWLPLKTISLVTPTGLKPLPVPDLSNLELSPPQCANVFVLSR